MLSELRIQNFAIIDRLDIQFAAGFNVITGETGAGKSIMIDAVDMMLGGRADSTLSAPGRKNPSSKASFGSPASHHQSIRDALEREGIEMPTSDEVTLTRELRSNGRNVCRLNGTTVSLQFYRDIGQQLVDIHGQSDHLSLLRQPEHLHLLDRYANLESQRAALGALVGELTACGARSGSLSRTRPRSPGALTCSITRFRRSKPSRRRWAKKSRFKKRARASPTPSIWPNWLRNRCGCSIRRSRTA